MRGMVSSGVFQCKLKSALLFFKICLFEQDFGTDLMMKKVWRAVLLVGGCSFSLMSCAIFRGEKKETPDQAELDTAEPAREVEKVVGEVPRLVGRVVIVEAEQEFVLFKRVGMQRLDTQSLLSLVGEDGRTASLRMSGEKHGRYFAADISSGMPRAGDLIYARSLPTDIQESAEVSSE